MIRMLTRNILLVFILDSLLTDFAEAASCPGSRTIGENNPNNKDDDLDGTTDMSTLIINNDYKVDCDCGNIYEWEYYAKTNTGTVHFQVWRLVSGTTYTLVGENIVTVTAGMVNQENIETVPNGQRIQVQQDDYLGIYNPGNPIISNKNEGSGKDFKETTLVGNIGVGNTFNWGTVTTDDDRKYAINAKVSPGSAPTFTNLGGASVTMVDAATIGYYLFTVTVYDADGDTLTTTMTTETYFDFDTSTLQVTVKTAGVPPGSYTLNFQTSDPCGGSDTGTLSVTVTNSAPVISPSSLPHYSFIHEDTTAETLLRSITVTDNTPSDTVTCTETEAKFLSKLTPSLVYGVYSQTTPAFDYATQKKYTVAVTCTDSYSASDSSFLNVYILPNTPPTFTNLPNSVSISTTTTSGTSVFQVSTSDSEGDTITFSTTCSVVSCPFTVDTNSGLVQTNTNLNALTTVGYDLYITISDGQNTVGSRTLTILITGINTSPVIQNLPLTFSLSVMETVGLSTSIYQVRAIDPDTATQTLTYSATFTPVEGATVFTVDTATGLIRTSSTTPIDYEALTAKSFTVDVSVTDGQATDTQSVTVAVVDVNETPAFSTTLYYVTGNEGASGTVVGDPVLTTTDPDPSDVITYSISCTDFTINPATGVVSFAVDYDLDVAGTASSVSCTLTASDGDLEAYATLFITVNDINDNTPIFGSEYYTFYTSSFAAVGDVLGSLTATDGDLGIFGSLTYSLDQSNLAETYFGVTGTGGIYITKSTSSLGVGTSFTFTAAVTDYGGLNDTASITVIVTPTTTAPSTTTTERYLHFIEDPDNVIWITVMGFCTLGFAILTGYLIYKHDILNSFRIGVKEVCSKSKPKRTNIRKTRKKSMRIQRKQRRTGHLHHGNLTTRL